jgi:hypothetical protein
MNVCICMSICIYMIFFLKNLWNAGIILQSRKLGDRLGSRTAEINSITAKKGGKDLRDPHRCCLQPRSEWENVRVSDIERPSPYGRVSSNGLHGYNKISPKNRLVAISRWSPVGEIRPSTAFHGSIIQNESTRTRHLPSTAVHPCRQQRSNGPNPQPA